jgi:hypothetical protein
MEINQRFQSVCAEHGTKKALEFVSISFLLKTVVFTTNAYPN